MPMIAVTKLKNAKLERVGYKEQPVVTILFLILPQFSNLLLIF